MSGVGLACHSSALLPLGALSVTTPHAFYSLQPQPHTHTHTHTARSGQIRAGPVLRVAFGRHPVAEPRAALARRWPGVRMG